MAEGYPPTPELLDAAIDSGHSLSRSRASISTWLYCGHVHQQSFSAWLTVGFRGNFMNLKMITQYVYYFSLTYLLVIVLLIQVAQCWSSCFRTSRRWRFLDRPRQIPVDRAGWQVEAPDAHVPPPMRGDGTDTTGYFFPTWSTTSWGGCRTPRDSENMDARPTGMVRGCGPQGWV